ncbi:MAG: WD40 repeat domain-containing protein [Crinalium sp.]
MSKQIEDVKQRLASKSEQERLAALSETLNYGQQGLELLIAQSLKDKSEIIKQSAYWIFHGHNPCVTENIEKSLITSPTDTITSLAISSDNNILVGGSWKKILVWNLQTGKILRTLEGHSHWVLSVAISSDGQTLVSGSADKTLKVWNLQTGKNIHTLKKHSSWVTAIAITPDGKSIVSGSADKTIKVWDLKKGNLTKNFKNDKELSAVLSLCISADGKIIASGSTNNKITLWDLESGQLVRTLEEHSNWVQALSITSDNTILISGSRDGTVKFWQAQAGEESTNQLGSILKTGLVDIGVTVVGFSLGFPIGVVALGALALSRLVVGETGNQASKKLPVDKLKCTETYSHSQPVKSVAHNFNQTIIIAGSNTLIYTSKLVSNKAIYNLLEQFDFISSVTVSTDQKTLAVAGKDWVILLDLPTSKTLHPLQGSSYKKLSKLIITEPKQQLHPGQSQYFYVKGLDQNNNEITLNNQNIKWEATGGKIKQGLFTAGQEEGEFEIKVKSGIFEDSIAVSITEPPRLTHFSVTPVTARLEFEEIKQFTAKVLDQRGNRMPLTVLWEANQGGTIDQKGKFKAGSQQGNFEVIASVSSMRRVIPIKIIEPRKLQRLIFVSSIPQLEFGQSYKFRVKGIDQYKNNISISNITWSASSGRIDNDGRFYADFQEETVVIKVNVGAINTFIEIKVCEPSRITQIQVIPSFIILKLEDKATFSVVAFNQRGEKILVNDVEWTATDGLINSNGDYCTTEFQKGDCEINATVGQLNAKANVTVTPVVKKLKIFPEQLELKPEEEFIFTVTGFDQTGEPIEIINVEWTTTTGGSISSKGVFQGGYTKREVTVTVKFGNISDTAILTLLPVLRKLKIYPSFVYLKPNEEQTFAVKGFDQFGQEIEPGNLYWKTTGGKIEQDGTLTVAQSDQGYLQVTATSVLTPKHTQNVRTLLLYTGISSRLISWFISYETLIKDVLAFNSTSADTEEELDDLIIEQTPLDVNVETIEETNIIVHAEEELDLELNESPEAELIVETDILDFHTALEGWLAQKLRKLIARCFLSISRFCLNEATANLSASADVFVLAVEYNPYKYFECLKVLSGHSGFVSSLAITLDGQKLISGSWDDTIKIWNLSTGELLDTLEAHTDDVECVAIAPEGQTLVSAGWDNDSTIKIWDLNTSNLLHSIYCEDSVVLVAITPDGQKIVSGETKNVIKVWDLNDQELLQNLGSPLENFPHPSWWHKCIVITPDGKRIISALKTLMIYDLETGEVVNNLRPKINYTYSLAMTRDGKKLISSHEKQIKIWDLKAKHLKTLFNLDSCANEVYALAVTPDDQRFVSSGRIVDRDLENEITNYGSLIEIWDINTGEKIHSIQEYHSKNSCVYCLAITPDGKQIITGYGDGSIKIWGIPELNEENYLSVENG